MPPAQHECDPGLRYCEGGIFLPRTGDNLDNTGLGLGGSPCPSVGFYSWRRLHCVELTVYRLYWLSVFEGSCPDMWPLFFEVDYAPPILKLVCRPEGERRSAMSVVVNGLIG